MIKINLKVSGGKISGSGDANIDVAMSTEESEIQKQGALRLLIILLGPALLYVWETQNIPTKKVNLQNRQSIFNELSAKNESAKSAVDEIKKYKADESKLKDQISTIEALRKDRMREVRILDLVQREMPEKMWLTRIELKDNKININGYASTDSELTQFMDVLSKSMFMQDVNLIRTSEKNIEGVLLKDFSIIGILKKTEFEAAKGAG